MIEADGETKAPKKIGREPPVCMKSVLALRNNTCMALHLMLCFVQIAFFGVEPFVFGIGSYIFSFLFKN